MPNEVLPLQGINFLTKEQFLSIPVEELKRNEIYMVPILEVLPGTVIAFAGNFTPEGYLLCNGAEISRQTYATLFSVVGTTYGIGDGELTFNLPDATDRFIQGSLVSGIFHQAGLPNITGNIRSFTEYNKSNAQFLDAGVAGAFYWEMSWDTNTSKAYATSTNVASGSSDTIRFVPFDASKSNPIYGLSNTVQPASLTMRFCIKY